ncbi:unnamed protein product [Rhodiola kirilowii]
MGQAVHSWTWSATKFGEGVGYYDRAMTMAFTMKQTSLIVAALGVASGATI